MFNEVEDAYKSVGMWMENRSDAFIVMQDYMLLTYKACGESVDKRINDFLDTQEKDTEA